MSLASRAASALWSITWRWMTESRVDGGGAASTDGADGAVAGVDDAVDDADRAASQPQPQPQPTRRRRQAVTVPAWRGRACAYCGEPATTTDHLRPVITRGVPSGYGCDVWNCVPACFLCNCSKGSSSWQTFMTRTKGKAPLARGVTEKDNAVRMARLRAFERRGASMAQQWRTDVHAEAIARARAEMMAVLQTFEKHMCTMRDQVLLAAEADDGASEQHGSAQSDKGWDSDGSLDFGAGIGDAVGITAADAAADAVGMPAADAAADAVADAVRVENLCLKQ